jgi:hypothetical protein
VASLPIVCNSSRLRGTKADRIEGCICVSQVSPAYQSMAEENANPFERCRIRAHSCEFSGWPSSGAALAAGVLDDGSAARQHKHDPKDKRGDLTGAVRTTLVRDATREPGDYYRSAPKNPDDAENELSHTTTHRRTPENLEHILPRTEFALAHLQLGRRPYA